MRLPTGVVTIPLSDRPHRGLLDALLRHCPDSSINVVDRALCDLYAVGTRHARLGLVPAAPIGRRLDDIVPAEPLARVGIYCRRAFPSAMVMFALLIVRREHIIRAWPLAEPNGAISAIVAVAQAVPTRPMGAENLTQRQREVASLVATGLTNRQIAERLTLGTGTIRNDVGNILQQLGFATRTQLGL
jgi:DNA-binding CsgD family transcriptional regulator